MNRIILWSSIGAALLIIGTVALLGSRTYYPVVVVNSPADGVTLTFLSKPLSVESGCRQTADAIADTMRQNCPQCRIDRNECLSRPEQAWREALAGRPIDRFAVHAGDRVIMIDAPQPLAGQACAAMASQIAKTVPAAYCARPGG